MNANAKKASWDLWCGRARVAAGALAGYVVVSTGLSVAVLMWFVHGELPAGVVGVVYVVLAMLATGSLAGVVAAFVGGAVRGKTAVRAAAAMTVFVAVGNIVLGVVTEPVWFTLTQFVTLIPALLIVGERVARRGSAS